MIMTLAEKMSRWGILKAEMDLLEIEIEDEVLPLKKSQEFGDVIAKFNSGRGSHDFPSIAKEMNVSPDRIKEFTETKIITDWVGLFKGFVVPEEIRLRHYKPGKPSVSVKLLSKPTQKQKGVPGEF